MDALVEDHRCDDKGAVRPHVFCAVQLVPNAIPQLVTNKSLSHMAVHATNRLQCRSNQPYLDT